MQKHLFAYYFANDINERDQEAKRIAEPFTKRWVGSGTFIGGERDLQWQLKDGCEEIACAALKRAGFRVKVREIDVPERAQSDCGDEVQ